MHFKWSYSAAIRVLKSFISNYLQSFSLIQQSLMFADEICCPYFLVVSSLFVKGSSSVSTKTTNYSSHNAGHSGPSFHGRFVFVFGLCAPLCCLPSLSLTAWLPGPGCCHCKPHPGWFTSYYSWFEWGLLRDETVRQWADTPQRKGSPEELWITDIFAFLCQTKRCMLDFICRKQWRDFMVNWEKHIKLNSCLFQIYFVAILAKKKDNLKIT